MEIYRYHKTYNEESLKEFFQKPKELQRLAFVGNHNIPVSTYDTLIVTDDYAVIERGKIIPVRGLHGIFPCRSVMYKWRYSASSKRCSAISGHDKSFIKDVLKDTDKYEFVKDVPSDVLCGTIVRDILYGKLTNPHDAVIKYGKKLGVKHMNKHVFMLADKISVSPCVIMSTMNLSQLQTCYQDLIDRISESYHFRILFQDMIQQAYALEETINLMWSHNRMNEEHVNWSRRLMKLELGSKSLEYIWPEHFNEAFEHSGLELLNTEKRVFEEGYNMSHCIYTNYWQLIKDKKYIALAICLPTGPATIGMRLKGFNVGKPQFVYEQCYHKRNDFLSTEETIIVKTKLKNLSDIFSAMSNIAVSQLPEEFTDNPADMPIEMPF